MVFDRGVDRELVSRPFRHGMFGDREVNEPSAVMSQNHEHEEDRL